MKVLLLAVCAVFFIGCSATKDYKLGYQEGYEAANNAIGEEISGVVEAAIACDLENEALSREIVLQDELLKKCVNINEDGQFTDK